MKRGSIHRRSLRCLFSLLICLQSQALRAFSSGSFEEGGERFEQLLGQHEFDAAQVLLDELASEAREAQQAQVTLWKGMLAKRQGLDSMAIAQFERAEWAAIGHRDTAVWAWSRIFSAEMKSASPLDSLLEQRYEMAIELLSAVRDTQGLIKLNYDLARRHCKMGAFERAEPHLNRAEWLSFRFKAWRNLATILNFQGVQLFNQGEYERSVEFCLFSLKIYQRLEEKAHLARTYNHLGSALYQMQDPAKALEYWNQGLEICQTLELPQVEANLLTNLGVLMVEQEDYPKAESHFKKCAELYLDINYPTGLASCYTNLAYLYDIQGDYVQAIHFQLEALEQDRQAGDRLGESWSLLNLGVYYLNAEEYAPAMKSLEAGLDNTQEMNQQDLVPQFYTRISEVYKATDNFEAALRYKEQADSLQSGLDSPALRDSARSQILEFEGEQKDEQISQLQSDNSRQQWLLWSIIGVGLIALLAGLRFTIRKRAEIQVRDAQMRGLEREKSLLKGQEENLRKDLRIKEQHIQELKQTQAAFSSQFSGDFLKKVRQNQLWPTYLAEFEQLHPEFVQTLNRDFPHLTTNDLRLLSLIRLNLSSGEIANALNITPAGVKKARQRLRKKLNLAPRESLSQFLKQI